MKGEQGKPIYVCPTCGSERSEYGSGYCVMREVEGLPVSHPTTRVEEKVAQDLEQEKVNPA